MKVNQLLKVIVSTAFLCVVGAGCSTYKITEVPKEESHVQLVPEKIAELRSTLIRHCTKDMYLAPTIPPKKLENARRTCVTPLDEKIIALIDASSLGGAEYCLLVGSSGIYFNNDWAGDPPGRTYLSYADIQNAEIKRYDAFSVSVGGPSFCVAGCSMSKEAVINLLRDVQTCIRTMSNPENKSKLVAGATDVGTEAATRVLRDYLNKGNRTPEGNERGTNIEMNGDGKRNGDVQHSTYIPPELESHGPSGLMAITWTEADVGLGQGKLWKIDGQEIKEVNAHKVLLKPGKHTFTYYTYASYKEESLKSQSTMTFLSHMDGDFAGDAAKEYTWREVLTHINPHALPPANTTGDNTLFQWKGSTTYH